MIYTFPSRRLVSSNFFMFIFQSDQRGNTFLRINNPPSYFCYRSLKAQNCFCHLYGGFIALEFERLKCEVSKAPKAFCVSILIPVLWKLLIIRLWPIAEVLYQSSGSELIWNFLYSWFFKLDLILAALKLFCTILRFARTFSWLLSLFIS